MGPGIVQRMEVILYIESLFSFRGVLQFARMYLRRGSVILCNWQSSVIMWCWGIWKIILLFSRKENVTGSGWCFSEETEIVD